MKKKSNTAVATPSQAQAKIPLRRPGQQLPIQEEKKKVSIRCAKCKNNDVNSPHLKFHCVPKYPAELRSNNPEKQSIVNREGRALLHLEMMERIKGKRRKHKTKYYICEEHIFEVVTKSREFEYKGEKITQRYRLTVPSGSGPRAICTTTRTWSMTRRP